MSGNTEGAQNGRDANDNGANKYGGNGSNCKDAGAALKKHNPVVLGPKNVECISKDGMVCCPCSEGVKYSYFAPTQCYVPMEYYVPVQCCVPVECEIRYGTPFIPGKDNPASNCN